MESQLLDSRRLIRYFSIKSKHILWIGWAVSILAAYLILLQIYRVNNVDDAWSLSFAYNYLFKHISSDVTFGASTGGCGVQFFGKTFVFVYGPILNWLGWTKENALIISSVLVGIAGLFWFGIIRKLTGKPKLAAIFCLTMLFMPPCFLSAHEARPDALTFLLISMAIFTFIKGWYFSAGFLSMVAWETHPMGMLVFFYFAALATGKWILARKRLERADILRFGIGILCGIIYFYALHYQYLNGAFLTLLMSNKGHRGELPNFVLQYFLSADKGTHIPELLLFIVAFRYFIKLRMYEENRYIVPLFVFLLIPLLVIHRPNYRYTIFVYPIFLWMALEVFARFKRLNAAILLICGMMLIQYELVYYHNHSYNIDGYVRQVKAAVPADHLPVVGNADSWFAFKDRDFYALNYVKNFHRLHLKRLYLIEDGAYRSGTFPALRRVITKDYQVITIRAVLVNKRLYRIKYLKLKPRKGLQFKMPYGFLGGFGHYPV